MPISGVWRECHRSARENGNCRPSMITSPCPAPGSRRILPRFRASLDGRRKRARASIDGARTCISILLHGCGITGSIAASASVIPPLPLEEAAHNGLHYALRERSRKTVMALRNFQKAAALGLGVPDTTAEERQSLDQLFSLTYEELRRLASSVKRGDLSITLSPTALVNEAWVKLANSMPPAATSQLHFKRIAARAMRQVLIEAARRRNTHKRGGDGESIFVTFDDSLHSSLSSESDLLSLDVALDELARLEPRQAAIVETRFFGGLQVSEISILLGVSEATILRDWRAAKAWLGQALRRTA